MGFLVEFDCLFRFYFPFLLFFLFVSFLNFLGFCFVFMVFAWELAAWVFTLHSNCFGGFGSFLPWAFLEFKIPIKKYVVPCFFMSHFHVINIPIVGALNTLEEQIHRWLRC